MVVEAVSSPEDEVLVLLVLVLPSTRFNDAPQALSSTAKVHDLDPTREREFVELRLQAIDD